MKPVAPHTTGNNEAVTHYLLNSKPAPGLILCLIAPLYSGWFGFGKHCGYRAVVESTTGYYTGKGETVMQALNSAITSSSKAEREHEAERRLHEAIKETLYKRKP